jgi:hypothetical protein
MEYARRRRRRAVIIALLTLGLAVPGRRIAEAFPVKPPTRVVQVIEAEQPGTANEG